MSPQGGRPRAEWSHTLLPYNVTMQMYVGRLCVYALTHTGRRESPPHNPKHPPLARARRRSPKMVLRMWVYTRGTFSWSSPLAFKEGGRSGLWGGGGRAVPNGWPRGGSPVCRMAARTYVRHLSTSKQQRRQISLGTTLLKSAAASLA